MGSMLGNGEDKGSCAATVLLFVGDSVRCGMCAIVGHGLSSLMCDDSLYRSGG